MSLPHTFGQEQIILFVLEVGTHAHTHTHTLQCDVPYYSNVLQSSLHDRALEAGADIVAAEEIFQQV